MAETPKDFKPDEQEISRGIGILCIVLGLILTVWLCWLFCPICSKKCVLCPEQPAVSNNTSFIEILETYPNKCHHQDSESRPPLAIQVNGKENTTPNQLEVPVVCHIPKVEGIRIHERREIDSVFEPNPGKLCNYTTPDLSDHQETPPYDHQETPPCDHQETPLYDHQETPPYDHQELPSCDHQETPYDHQETPYDHQETPYDHQETPSCDHQETPPYDHQETPPCDHQETPLYDHQETPYDHQETPYDHQKTPPYDHQETPPYDHQELPSCDHQESSVTPASLTSTGSCSEHCAQDFIAVSYSATHNSLPALPDTLTNSLPILSTIDNSLPTFPDIHDSFPFLPADLKISELPDYHEHSFTYLPTIPEHPLTSNTTRTMSNELIANPSYLPHLTEPSTSSMPDLIDQGPYYPPRNGSRLWFYRNTNIDVSDIQSSNPELSGNVSSLDSCESLGPTDHTEKKVVDFKNHNDAAKKG